jgi:hypothetical protein
MEVGDVPATERCPAGHPLGLQLIHEGEAHVDAHVQEGGDVGITCQTVFCTECATEHRRRSASERWEKQAP